MVFQREKFPIDEAISMIHPKDGRPVFVLPWEGAVLLGTTDVDHKNELSEEPSISAEEVDYLMEGIHSVFPESGLTSQTS